MVVDLLIHRKGAIETEYYCIASAAGWRIAWLPAAAELGLDLVPLLGDGTFTDVSAEYLPQVIAQLARLRSWMIAHQHAEYAEHLDRILPALTTINPNEDSVCFG